MPRFGILGGSVSSGGEVVPVRVLIGAFQVCGEASTAQVSFSLCSAVDGSCQFTFGSQTGTMPCCATFTAFRSFLITSLVLAGFALIAALAHTFMASPYPNLAHFTFVGVLLSAVTAVISLICWLSFASGTDLYSGVAGTPNDPSAKGSYPAGPSFYLLISAIVGALVGLVVWLYGRMQQRAPDGSMAAAPYYHSASTLQTRCAAAPAAHTTVERKK